MNLAGGFTWRWVLTIKLKSSAARAWDGLLVYLAGGGCFLISWTFLGGDFSFYAYFLSSALASLFLRGDYLTGVTLFLAGDFLEGSTLLVVAAFLAGVIATFWDSLCAIDLWDCLGVSRTSGFFWVLGFSYLLGVGITSLGSSTFLGVGSATFLGVGSTFLGGVGSAILGVCSVFFGGDA